MTAQPLRQRTVAEVGLGPLTLRVVAGEGGPQLHVLHDSPAGPVIAQNVFLTPESAAALRDLADAVAIETETGSSGRPVDGRPGEGADRGGAEKTPEGSS